MNSDSSLLDSVEEALFNKATFIEELWGVAKTANPFITVPVFEALLDSAIDMIDQHNETKKVDTTHRAFKEFLTEALNEGPVSVTFRKVSDGKTRVMLCTRNQYTIAEHQKKFGQPGGGSATTNETGEHLKVYDLEQHGWRSFRWDSIITYCLEE